MDNNTLDSSMDLGGADERFENVAPLSDDWYHGHKVVAMPSSAFGGKSIREVVSSRNESNQHQQAVSRPRRSNSLGRQPMVQPQRDLVQDIYDRMGVSYTRGMTYDNNDQQETPMAIQSQPSFSESSITSNNSINGNSNNNGGGKRKDKFSGRYRAAAATVAAGRTGGRPAAAPDNTAAVATRGRGRTTQTRDSNSRTTGDESEGQRRARSLSRGRSVQGRWPPSRDQVNASTSDIAAHSTKSHKTGGVPAGSGSSESSTAHVASTIKRSHSFDARPQYGRGGGGFRSPITAPMATAELNYINKMRVAPPSSSSAATDTSNNNAMRDEKKENDDASESSTAGGGEEGAAPIPSIKDRISAFAGNKPAGTNSNGGQPRNSRRNTYGGPSSGAGGGGYMKSPPPPKVDIYETTTTTTQATKEEYRHPDDPALNVQENNNNGDDDYSHHHHQPHQQQQQGGPPELSTVPPSATAAAAADVAAKYMRPSQTKKSHRQSAGADTSASGGGVRGGSSIANSYLTGINSSSSSTNGPSSVSKNSHGSATSGRSCFGGVAFAELPSSASDEVMMDGNSSVGASSAVSYGGDSAQASLTRKSTPAWQKPSSAYNNHNSSNTKSVSSVVTSNNSSSNNVNGNGNINVSPEMIEKLVDERVQVELREVEARMEGLLRKWMDCMNSKITNRLDAMESSIKDSMPDPCHRHEL